MDISDETRDYIEFPGQVRYRARLAAQGEPVRLVQHWDRRGGRHRWEIRSDGTSSWAVSEDAGESMCLDAYAGMFRFLHWFGPFDVAPVTE